MSYEQYQETKQEAHWDIAWQIFDEVNEHLDQTKRIDLNCLDTQDAIAIAKQKIYDTAMVAQQRPDFMILNILTSDAQSVLQGNNRVKNLMLEMIKDELKLDHYFFPEDNVILVKIDKYTMENPVLKEW